MVAAGFWTGLASVFSWLLLAELAVGRIILARKLSLTGLVALSPSLIREPGRSGAGWAGREGREGCRRTPAVVLATVLAAPAPAALLREDGFLVRVEAVVLVRLVVEGAPVPVLAEDAWVCAVMEAGKRIGLVGDLGRDLTLFGEVFELS